MRGQVLIKLGRTDEGRRELDRSVAMSHERREKRRQELEGPEPLSGSSPE
jgi:predicted RNA polymerase sigma factor